MHRKWNKSSEKTINELWDTILELQFQVKALRASAQAKFDDEQQKRIKNLEQQENILKMWLMHNKIIYK